MLIIRRSNCINTVSGIVFSVSDRTVCKNKLKAVCLQAFAYENNGRNSRVTQYFRLSHKGRGSLPSNRKEAEKSLEKSLENGESSGSVLI